MISRGMFLKAAVGAAALAALPGAAHAAPKLRGGVAYDTGVLHGAGGPLSRVRWSRALMQQEVRVVRDELRCASITAFGTDVGRQLDTTRFATSRGLRTFLQPRLYDHPQAEILEHLAETARQAERLRQNDDIVLVTGCEHLLFTPGITPGATFMERIENLQKLPPEEFPKIFKRLNEFIGQAVDVARRHFRGKITYAAIPVEPINWNLFDIVGIDYYEYFETQQEYTEDLARFRRWNKPIMVLEFGSCTYVGAPQRGGMGWDAIDHEQDPPRLRPGIVRSEREQAQHIARMLNVFAAEGLAGAHIYTFIAPDAPHRPSCPELDLDTGAYGLVKVIRRDDADEASPYRWEPKQSFHALARHNHR